jgi:hypothetical protein
MTDNLPGSRWSVGNTRAVDPEGVVDENLRPTAARTVEAGSTPRRRFIENLRPTAARTVEAGSTPRPVSRGSRCLCVLLAAGAARCSRGPSVATTGSRSAMTGKLRAVQGVFAAEDRGLQGVTTKDHPPVFYLRLSASICGICGSPFRTSALDAGCWVLDVGCSTFAASSSRS